MHASNLLFANLWNREFRTTLRLPFAHTSLKSVVDIGPISLNKTITLLGAERFANPAKNHRLDIKDLVNNRKNYIKTTNLKRLAAFLPSAVLMLMFSRGRKVLFVKQTTPFTIISQNPTLENKAVEPIVKGGMPFLVANVAVFFPLKIKSQVFLLFQKQVCMQVRARLICFGMENKFKSRSSEMNTFSRKPTLPKSNIAPKN